MKAKTTNNKTEPECFCPDVYSEDVIIKNNKRYHQDCGGINPRVNIINLRIKVGVK